MSWQYTDSTNQIVNADLGNGMFFSGLVTSNEVQEYLANGGTIAPYVAPTLSAADQAAELLAGGLTITSTSTSAIDGTYSVDFQTQTNINATVTYILLNNAFPGNASTMAWFDISGTAHVFPSVTVFKPFATALADFVAQATIYANSNGTVGSLPSNTITIA